MDKKENIFNDGVKHANEMFNTIIKALYEVKTRNHLFGLLSVMADANLEAANENGNLTLKFGTSLVAQYIKSWKESSSSDCIIIAYNIAENLEQTMIEFNKIIKKEKYEDESEKKESYTTSEKSTV